MNAEGWVIGGCYSEWDESLKNMGGVDAETVALQARETQRSLSPQWSGGMR
jgi:hypothetical protein